jgi:GT2 family glycosyltransferase
MASTRKEIGAWLFRRLARVQETIPYPVREFFRPMRDRFLAPWHRYVYPGFARRLRRYDPAVMPEVSIILITYNRLRMLRECLTSLLDKTKGDDFEIIVWNNGSNDGTKEFLDETVQSHPQVRVVHHPKNVGLNGLALSVPLARGFYILEMDDDVLRFPDDWLPKMLHAFKTVPKAGYLAANVYQDERTTGEKASPESYSPVDYGGVVVEHGPAWGWCTMTSLEVLKKIGNFPRRRGRIFFCEDLDFSIRAREAGYRLGIVQDVVVYHASGAAKNDDYGYLDLCLQKYSEGREYMYKYKRACNYAEHGQIVKE